MKRLQRSRTSPDFIPSPHNKSNLRRNAYRDGWSVGHGLACHNCPTAGESYWTEMDGKVSFEKNAHIDEAKEVHSVMCFAAADNYRCYSPFEYTAKAFNESRNPDAAWAAFEAGVEDAIFADLQGYDSESYGLEESES